MSGYHTFAWMPPSQSGDTKIAGSNADLNIKDAATQALSSKGLKLSQSHPDLIVNYSRIVGKGTYTTYYSPYYGGWGFGLGWGRWGGWYNPYYAFGGPFSYYGNITYADREHYKEGTLIIDLIDPQTRKIVWRGFGVGEVHHDPQKDVQDLPKVVNGILEQLQVSQMPMKMRQS